MTKPAFEKIAAGLRDAIEIATGRADPSSYRSYRPGEVKRMRQRQPVGDQSGRNRVETNLSKDELRTVANALNEICNGIWFTDSEFQTRIGVDRAEAESVLDKILSAIESSTENRPAVDKIDD